MAPHRDGAAAMSASETFVEWPVDRREAVVVELPTERKRPTLHREGAARRSKDRGWLMRRSLLGADILGLVMSFAVAEAATGFGSTSLYGNSETVAFVLSLPVWVVVAKLYGLYDRDEERTDHSTTDDMVGVFHLVTVGSWLVFASTWLLGLAEPKLTKLALFWLLANVTIDVSRAGARALCRHHESYLQNTVIVGAGDVGQLIARKILQHPEYGLNVVGLVDDHPRERRPDIGDLALLGGMDEVRTIVEELDVERIVVAFSNDSSEEVLELIRALSELDVRIDIVPRFFDIVGPGLGIHTVEGLPLIGLPPSRLPRSSRLLKRTLDVVLSAAALLVLALPFLVVALLIRLEGTGPVFFRQVRMGSEGTFRIWKFRTMVCDADERKAEYAHLNRHALPGGDPRMFKISDDPRVTRVGRWLRRYSVDELPQFLNVLLGEMSLVGPRPLILEEDQHVASWGRKRLQLRPGITGLWQVTGRNDIPFDEMVKLDYRYVASWSLFGDIRLMLRTVPILLRPSAG